MIRVLIVDDHPIVRYGLREVLAREPDIEVGGDADCGAAAIDTLRKGRIDIVLLDIALPGRSGLDVLKDVKSENPRLRVLMLSLHSEDQYAIRALKAGADGYLTKDSPPQELLKAIRSIMSGRKYMSERVADRLVMTLSGESEKLPHERLSDREHEIFLMIAAGKSLTEIGNELKLSVKTISTHRTHIVEKMGFEANHELTRYAIEHDLLK